MSIFSAFNKLRVYRRTVKELSRLSGRELADIGLNRGDIRRVARDAQLAV